MLVPFFHADVVLTPVVGTLLKKNGVITLDANKFFDDFESRFRQLVESVSLFKIRPSNNDLLLSFEKEKDFVATVRSASGVNIAMEIGWLFEPRQSEKQGLNGCFLRFQLSNGCIDERLSLFLDDLSLL